jgi:hypothetical protein
MSPWLIVGLSVGWGLALLLPGWLDTCSNVDREQTAGDPVREHLPDPSQGVQDRLVGPLPILEKSDHVLNIGPVEVLDPPSCPKLLARRLQVLLVGASGHLTNVVAGVQPALAQLVKVTLSRLTSAFRFRASRISACLAIASRMVGNV